MAKTRPKQRLRRYVYEDDEKEVTEWALQAIREERIPKPFYHRAKSPYYLKQFIKHKSPC